MIFLDQNTGIIFVTLNIVRRKKICYLLQFGEWIYSDFLKTQVERLISWTVGRLILGQPLTLLTAKDFCSILLTVCCVIVSLLVYLLINKRQISTCVRTLSVTDHHTNFYSFT